MNKFILALATIIFVVIGNTAVEAATVTRAQINTPYSNSWDNVRYAQEGMTVVGENNLYGYTDSTGRVIVAPKWLHIGDFNEGIVKINSISQQTYNANKSIYDKYGLDNIGSWFFADAKGFTKFVLKTTKSTDYVSDITKGFVAFSPLGSNYTMLYNSYGSNVFNTSYIKGITASGGVLSDGLMPVYDKKSKLYGYINNHGKFAIAPAYNMAYNFSNGYAIVKSGTKLAIIDRLGKQISKFTYDDILTANDTANIFNDGVAIVKRDGKWGVIDTIGNVVVDFEWGSINLFYDGIALVSKNYSYGFIDKKGNIIAEPIYESAMARFKEGFAAVKLNQKWGYINMAGEMAIQPTFDDASLFKYGAAIVSIGGVYRQIDATGNFINNNEYNWTGLNTTFVLNSNDNIIYYMKNNKWSIGYVTPIQVEVPTL